MWFHGNGISVYRYQSTVIKKERNEIEWAYIGLIDGKRETSDVNKMRIQIRQKKGQPAGLSDSKKDNIRIRVGSTQWKDNPDSDPFPELSYRH